MANKLTLNEDLFESFGRPDSWNDEPNNNFIVDLGDREDVCISFEDAVESANKNNIDMITEQPPYSTKIIRKWVRGADGKFDESIKEDLYLAPQEPSDETPATPEANGVAKLILDAINDESDTIKMYNDLIANTDNQDIIDIIQDITAEENNHLGMLQKALEIVSPNASNIEDGQEEAQGMIADEQVNADPEFVPVEESLDKSLNESFWFGKYIDVNGKTHKVYFKFEGNFEEAEEEFNEIIPEPYTKSVLSGQADEYGLKRDGFTLINESFGDSDEEELKKALENVVAVYVVDDAKESPVIYTEEFNLTENSGFDDEIEVNPVIVDAMLKGLQKCTAIYVEPTAKNKRFMKKYNMKPDDYLNLFNQVKSSDFNKAIHSIYPKYKDDVLFVFHCKDVALNAEVVNLSIYIKVNVSKSDEDSMIAISFHDLNQFESLNEDLHDKFKRDIKDTYKEWARQLERAESKRKEAMELIPDTATPEQIENFKKFVDETYPLPKDFKYDFPHNIEKEDFPFYVTYYAEYPIYEPAEGGYYYAGNEAIWSEGFNTREEALDFARQEIAEDDDNWEEAFDGYFILKGKYIGEDQTLRVEPRKAYLSGIKGWEPYQ